ncbi:unnamed protein product [Lasius platythorax]|uniref:Uncharacterized protein n=1 Tax=Lasius platythorax TaxID=488582 RepID=A0AAV2NED1_9HYME
MDLKTVDNVRDLFDTWSVIEFVNIDNESNAIEIVPTSWITITNDQIMCKWPEKNVRKCILKKEPPKDCWEKYIVQLILQTNSYEEALDVVHKKTRTDTDSSCSQLGRGKRKRKNKFQPTINNKRQKTAKNSSSDDDSNQQMTPPPSVTVMQIQNEPLNDLINDDDQDVDKDIQNMDKTANVDQNKADDMASEDHTILEGNIFLFIRRHFSSRPNKSWVRKNVYE